MLDGGFATTVVHSHETVAVVAFAALGMLCVLHVFWTFCSTGFEELCSSCSRSVVSFDRSIACGLRGLLRLARKGWYGRPFVIACREDRSIVVQASAPRGSHHRNHHKLHTPVSSIPPTGRFKHGLARLAKKKTEHEHDSSSRASRLPS